MRFGLRRSSLAAESILTEPEPRRRNRLSKPLTGNATKIQVSTSASAINVQVPTQSKNTSTTELASAGPLSPTLGNVWRQQIRSEMLAPDNDKHLPIHTMKNDSSWSVANMVGQIEGKAVSDVPQQQEEALPSRPLSPITPNPQKRKSFLLRRLSLQRSSSLSSTPSDERIHSPESESPVPLTPNALLDRIADSPSIPATRRSSFTPGAATRKLSPIASQEDMQEHKVIEEVDELEGSLVESECFDWQPPPPRTAGRPGTPSDMGYSQLGGLRHGSLQVVNGRASPALSEVSKVSRQLLAVLPPHRDVSSEYGDAEEGFEETNFLSRHNTSYETAGRRVFSWEKDDDKSTPRSHPLQSVMSSQEEPEATSSEDYTSLMAQEYIAELGASPFEPQRSESPVRTIRRTRSEGSLWTGSSCSSLHSSPSVDPDLSELSPVSPIERSLSPSGSVIRKTSIVRARSRTQELQVATDDDHEVCDSAMSWYSPVEPSMPIDEAFQSAVEFQVQLSPHKVGLQPPQAAEKSDSGYSSSNSLRSLQLTKATPPPAEINALPEVLDSTMSISTLGSSRPPSFLGLRPSILKSRRTEPNVPTFAKLHPNVVLSNAAPVVKLAALEPESIASKPAKARKKMFKKRRPLSQPPGQISVVQVHSFEEVNIPQVSLEARENLQMRSQAVPELEQTYVMPNLERGRPSTSNLDLSTSEFRFPSPAPDQESTRKRSRSRSRPRSWFGRKTTDMSSSRRNSGISQMEAIAIINDFGTDGAVLGRSPYDLGVHVTLSQRSMARSVMSAVTPHSRSMMDDETAVELSRRRSRSLRELDNLAPEQRPSFNDRGGVPGRSLRPASFIGDAPPITPEMLAKAYRTSSMQQQSSMTIDVAPPPPPHSPRPLYLEYENNESTAIAPPTPSHSPRPVDISADPWAAQAAAWEARKKSAGEALRRQSWDSRRYEQFPEAVQSEPLYPAIPPRQKAYNSIPEASPGRPNEHEPTYARQSRKDSMSHDIQHYRTSHSRKPSRPRPLPSSWTPTGTAPSRPQSNANSVRSLASSMVEQLPAQSFERPQQPPAFGRYSGGMGFGYEHGNGFGGSAGTRSASGKAYDSRRGVSLRSSYGVDLRDVPVAVVSKG